MSKAFVKENGHEDDAAGHPLGREPAGSSGSIGPLRRVSRLPRANAARDGKPIKLAGRIDRLVVGSDHVLVVDFKSDANPVLDPGRVPAAYLAQLGLYALVAGQLFPHLEVRAAILWTSLESLLELPSEALAGAASAFTMR